MKIIPLIAAPSQSFITVLAGQTCEFTISQKSTGLYMDLTVNRTPILSGIICRDRNKMVRYPYLGFIGDLAFMDTAGLDDPEYTGLGDRYQLMYLEASDL